MVCSAQHYLITIFKQQIRGVGKTFHRGGGEGVLRHFLARATNQASFVRTTDWRLKVRQLRHNIARVNFELWDFC